MAAIKHPFLSLKPEYSALLASMVITRKADIDKTARRLLKNKSLYQQVSEATGVPIIWMAASFEREASSRFNLSPAQGDPWDEVSTHVPKNRGPFKSWAAAAIDAYGLNGLQKVGAENWTWELMCFYGEMFNGFGYRDYHHMHSPYLWGGTNIQQRGKYTSDGKFDTEHFDMQLGIVPMMRSMVEMDPSLALNIIIQAPMRAPLGVHDAMWLQQSLNLLGEDPALVEDGSYGRKTMEAVKAFQTAYQLRVDGFAGPETNAKIVGLLAALKPTA